MKPETVLPWHREEFRLFWRRAMSAERMEALAREACPPGAAAEALGLASAANALAGTTPKAARIRALCA